MNTAEALAKDMRHDNANCRANAAQVHGQVIKSGGIRTIWYDCFDSSLTELRRAEARREIRETFGKFCGAKARHEPRFSRRIQRRLLGLPEDTVIVPVMVRGFATGTRIKAFLDSFGRPHDFALVGYSSGKHSNGRFRDGNPVCGNVFMSEDDRDRVARGSAILLVDGVIQSGETMREVTDSLIACGGRDIHAFARRNAIFALRQKSLIGKIHPALASVIR